MAHLKLPSDFKGNQWFNEGNWTHSIKTLVMILPLLEKTSLRVCDIARL